MQEGVWRSLYDGPVLVKDLKELKPHAGCHGRGCHKIAQNEKEDNQWNIVRGKPYCSDCFSKKNQA